VEQTNMGALGHHLNLEDHKKCLGTEGEVRSLVDFREFGDLAKVWMHIVECIKLADAIAK